MLRKTCPSRKGSPTQCRSTPSTTLAKRRPRRPRGGHRGSPRPRARSRQVADTKLQVDRGRIAADILEEVVQVVLRRLEPGDQVEGFRAGLRPPGRASPGRPGRDGGRCGSRGPGRPPSRRWPPVVRPGGARCCASFRFVMSRPIASTHGRSPTPSSAAVGPFDAALGGPSRVTIGCVIWIPSDPASARRNASRCGTDRAAARSVVNQSRPRTSSGRKPVTRSRNGLTRTIRPSRSSTRTTACAVAIRPSAKSRSWRNASSACRRSVTSSTVPTWPINSP